MLISKNSLLVLKDVHCQEGKGPLPVAELEKEFEVPTFSFNHVFVTVEESRSQTLHEGL